MSQPTYTDLHWRNLPEVRSGNFRIVGSRFNLVVEQDETTVTFYLNTDNGVHHYKVELTNAPMFLAQQTFESIVENAFDL